MARNLKPYVGDRTDSNGKPYVAGPGNGFSYYGGTLWPQSRRPSAEDALAVAELANEAYRQGYQAAQHDMRAALGLE